jgi:hypothetical protein
MAASAASGAWVCNGRRFVLWHIMSDGELVFSAGPDACEDAWITIPLSAVTARNPQHVQMCARDDGEAHLIFFVLSTPEGGGPGGWVSRIDLEVMDDPSEPLRATGWETRLQLPQDKTPTAISVIGGAPTVLDVS